MLFKNPSITYGQTVTFSSYMIEGTLPPIIKVNPTKTCLYPMRDYATCVEACAQPLIHNNLEGTQL